MTKKEKIMAIIATVILTATLSVTAVFAMTGNIEEPEQGLLQGQSAESLSVEPEEPSATPSFGIKGLTDEQIDWILYAMENGKLPELTAEQIAGLRAVLSENIQQGFLGGKVTMEQIDMMLAFMETGKFELTDELKEELKAELLAKADEMLGLALEEGYITQGLYDILLSALENETIEFTEELEAELLAMANKLLGLALEEGYITQGLHDILLSAMNTGNIEFTEELRAELQVNIGALLSLALAEGKIDQEHYDEISAILENGIPELTDEQKAEYMAKLYEALDEGLAEGKLPQEHYDMIISVLENGIPEFTEDEIAEIKAHVEEKGKEALVKGLKQGLAEGYIIQGVYDAMILALETGEIELTPKLLSELMTNISMLLERCLAEDKITQEQYDMIVSKIEEFSQAVVMRSF